GSGEFSSDWHLGLDAIVDDPKAVEAMQRDLDTRSLEISALSCHGNPLHPNPAYADRAGTIFRKTVLAAEKLGVQNWVSTGWPGYFEELLEWQWEEKIIPFWKEGAAYAGEHGVRLAFEPHPGD